MGFFQKLKVLGQKLPQNRAAQNSLISEFREIEQMKFKNKKTRAFKMKARVRVLILMITR